LPRFALRQRLRLMTTPLLSKFQTAAARLGLKFSSRLRHSIRIIYKITGVGFYKHKQLEDNQGMFRLIAAVDRKLGIAKQGFMPWNIPEDEQYFTDQTKTHGGNVLTGKTTFQLAYLGKPLEGRQNYILTHDKAPIENANVVNNLKDFYNHFEHTDVWVSGGANVFAQIMQDGKADELWLTQIEADFGCNQFFPDFSHDHYDLVQESDLREQNGFIFRYVIYKRVSP